MMKLLVSTVSISASILSFIILIIVCLGHFQHIDYFWGIEAGNIYIFTSSIFALFGLGLSIVFKKQIEKSIIILNSAFLFTSIFTLVILVQVF